MDIVPKVGTSTKKGTSTTSNVLVNTGPKSGGPIDLDMDPLTGQAETSIGGSVVRGGQNGEMETSFGGEGGGGP